MVGQNSLNQAISNIRELFHDDDMRAIIQTFPRRGYRFNSSYLSMEPEHAYFIDMHDGQPCIVPVPLPVIPRGELEPSPARPSNRSISYILGALVTVLLVAFIWRFDWLLAEQRGLSVLEENIGDLTIFYTSESESELIQIKSLMQPLRSRLANMITQPETVIFNRMHSFYEITCIDRGTGVRFLSIHKKQLSEISDAQLKGCLE